MWHDLRIIRVHYTTVNLFNTRNSLQTYREYSSHNYKLNISPANTQRRCEKCKHSPPAIPYNNNEVTRCSTIYGYICFFVCRTWTRLHTFCMFNMFVFILESSFPHLFSVLTIFTQELFSLVSFWMLVGLLWKFN